MKGASSPGSAHSALLSVAALATIFVPTSFAGAGDDAGMHAFNSEQFGGVAAQQRSTAAPPQGRGARWRRYAASKRFHVARYERPLTVQLNQRQANAGTSGPISIYDDTTLRPGDAVMTGKGMRVFVGQGSAPFTDADFVVLSQISGMPKQIRKELVAMDQAPRA